MTRARSAPETFEPPSFDAGLPYYKAPRRAKYVRRTPELEAALAEVEQPPEEPDYRELERQQTLQTIFGPAAPQVRSAIDSMRTEQGSRISGVAALVLGTLVLPRIG